METQLRKNEPGICASCHQQMELTSEQGIEFPRTQTRHLSYLIFVLSFALFWLTTSIPQMAKHLSPSVNIAWVVLQFALGFWAARDRRRNYKIRAKRKDLSKDRRHFPPKLLFYCRSCNTRLPFEP